ncbi:MAG: hypothetical protein K9N46_16435 [Candidatus Marinimicrobia bacterium]|nr:hypothetical protein [Candidatus Neomarinimicrobiota bacterium]MCF7827444.1 hypothetical protein [Candidatus Neomarinimicrobiota bacterium]MCF7882319.1 hypothetical protein [Candidatus Neomarinimicrobiota bacterium]
MGVSPAAQNEVLLFFGALMLFFAALALAFAGIQWLRNHPGSVRQWINVGVDCLKKLLRQIVIRFHFHRIPHSL